MTWSSEELEIAELVPKARAIGTVQRVWRRLNPDLQPDAIFVQVGNWHNPRTRKLMVLRSLCAEASGPDAQLKALLVPGPEPASLRKDQSGGAA